MTFKSVQLMEDLVRNLNINFEIYANEKWNKEYEALDLGINHIKCKSRLAKKTNKKQGYFVTLWTKDSMSVNQPFEYANFPEKLIVNVIDKDKLGQFIFPKDELLKREILSNHFKKGKMAFRVYPSWVTHLNSTALKTQAWQSKYFIDLTENIDKQTILRLYGEI